MKITLRILSYLKPHWRRLTIAYVALFSALGLQLYIPAVLARVIDTGLTDGNMRYLINAALVIVGLAVLQGVFTFLRAYLFQYLAEQVGYDLRNELYAKLQDLSFSYYDKAQTGQLMSRVTDDVNNIRGMLMMSLRALVLAIGMLVVVSIILISYNWQLALVSLASMPILVWWSLKFGVTVRPMFAAVQQQFGVMTSVLQENVAGARVVRAFAQEARENERFEAELQTLFARNLRATKLWSFFFPSILLLSGLSLGAILWLGGYQVITGALTVGTLVAFNRYVTLLSEPLRWIGFIVNRIARAIASGGRIFEILDTKSAIQDPAGAVRLNPMRGEVTFEDVSFRYAGAKRDALADLSFTARPGETIALLGPTGAGKSTIINLLPRFYDVTGGRILIDGHDVRGLALADLRSQIGTVLQETFLFSVSIAENIAYGRKGASREEIEAAARAARAHDFISALPDGYDTKLGERGVNLSGGQKQRLAIARALLLNPRILILDDATSSVDSETEHHIQQALQTLMEGRTSFVIAQRLTTVKEADQILVLQDGRIVERGTHIQLLQNGGFYAEIYDLQLRDQEDVMRDALAGDD
ncbi:MAG: Heterodimeric efflux ABC transporter, permease/ATP-binding subunit 1 [uncultured Thermomicrobiales bacterium]|uniref:Multidrug resistance-like ATP-binding protein MdlA n=1 Tax=uncultured Thermomicrobiales bacterium TaxID=1645740 RepID=A0A6J4UHE7_9BACT|nr:MAG: Heterodimeric efflux ABC transporter, permease/ATP-binding subunit 1 [uncultured Thermomicrobiales bacterium]